MKRWFLGLVPVALATLVAACGSSGSTFALIGVPAQNSYTDSANILISDNQCSYVVYRGNGVNPPEVGVPCTLIADKKDALGDPHSTVIIGFNTAKGQQEMTLHAPTQTNLVADTVPDIGVYLPNNWTLATPAPAMTIKSTAAGSIYSYLAVHISGVRCSMDITPVADNKMVTMPCGLTFWGPDSVSVAIPGALVSTVYAARSWPLNFTQDTSGNWTLAKVPNGFPAQYSVVSD